MSSFFVNPPRLVQNWVVTRISDFEKFLCEFRRLYLPWLVSLTVWGIMGFNKKEYEVRIEYNQFVFMSGL